MPGWLCRMCLPCTAACCWLLCTPAAASAQRQLSCLLLPCAASWNLLLATALQQTSLQTEWQQLDGAWEVTQPKFHPQAPTAEALGIPMRCSQASAGPQSSLQRSLAGVVVMRCSGEECRRAARSHISQARRLHMPAHLQCNVRQHGPDPAEHPTSSPRRHRGVGLPTPGQQTPSPRGWPSPSQVPRPMRLSPTALPGPWRPPALKSPSRAAVQRLVATRSAISMGGCSVR